LFWRVEIRSRTGVIIQHAPFRGTSARNPLSKITPARAVWFGLTAIIAI
jgi:hypothetical protein